MEEINKAYATFRERDRIASLGGAQCEERPAGAEKSIQEKAMKHQIIVRYSNRADRSLPLTLHLRKCIAAALEAEHVNVPCEINVLVTDDAGIRAINRAMRNIDRETDVLSFPMFQFTPGQFPEDVQEDIDPQTGLLPLGDMAISLERARDQAKRFGNSLRRETGYLTIHSILHLLGYDHMDEGEMKRQMRTREEIIAGQLGLQR